MAVQSKFLAVGAGVPAAEPHVAPLPPRRSRTCATGPMGWRSYAGPLRGGGRPAPDRGRRRPADRQLGVVDAQGRAATYTGQSASTGQEGSPARATRPRATSSSRRRRSPPSGEHSRDRRDSRSPNASSHAHGSAGSGRRPPGPAVRRAPRRPQGRRLMGTTDVVADLRVDDHRGPQSRSFAGSTPCTTSSSARHPTRSGSTWTSSSPRAPRAARRARLRRRGPRARLLDWAGTENLEERVKGSTASTPSRPRGATQAPSSRRRRKRRAE